MREEHLDLLAIFARLLIRVCLDDGTRHIPRRLMRATRNPAAQHVRATLLFQWTRLTVVLACAIVEWILFAYPPRRLQQLAGGAYVAVVGCIKGEGRATERAIVPL